MANGRRQRDALQGRGHPARGGAGATSRRPGNTVVPAVVEGQGSPQNDDCPVRGAGTVTTPDRTSRGEPGPVHPTERPPRGEPGRTVCARALPTVGARAAR